MNRTLSNGKYGKSKEQKDATTINICYGTPIIKNKIYGITRTCLFEAVDPEQFDPDTVAATFAMKKENLKTILLHVNGKLPSVTTIINCTEDLCDIYEWQLEKSRIWGIEGLQKFLHFRQNAGKKFHAAVEYLLRELKSHGTIMECHIKYSDLYSDAENRKCMKSISPFFEKLKKTEWMQIEGNVRNHILGYCGRFDALFEIEGVPTLVDWKTIGTESTKIKDQHSETKYLESDILQVVAYIAAINIDPSYSHLPRICNGAIIFAFEDGRRPLILRLNERHIEKYYKKLLVKLNFFWWKFSCAGPDESLIDFCYRPLS